MRRRITAMALALLCVSGLFSGGESRVAFAEEPVETFSGEVAMLKQENDRFVMQVTVENRGEDFAGTVQVIFGAGYDNCAYNTELTLPSRGKKQFTITVPEGTVDTAYGLCQVNFLDKSGNTLQSIQLKDIFGGPLSGIPVGILSDNYSGLTFLDAGGELFYIKGTNKPLKLVELTGDNLTGYLDGLYFLVIDQFNVSSLSEENIQAIEDWVIAGGWLIIGTGAYAEETLSGFSGDFLDVDVVKVSGPGEENVATLMADQKGYYYNYVYESDIDFSQMAVAELNYDGLMDAYGVYGMADESPDYPGVNSHMGHGAVSLLFFSLGEKELQKMNTYMIMDLYRGAMYLSNSYQFIRSGGDMDYMGYRALAFIDSLNSEVDFSGLEVLIVIYVILVGPVLYLILRKCKRREWYWVGAPVLGILFIAGVSLFGRTLRVNETKAYSVTVQQTEGSQADTWLLAYHSGVKPWMVHLRDSYEMAGVGFVGGYYYNNSGIDDYHYMVDNGSGGLSVGLKPRENFENGFLYAGGRTEGKGALTAQNLNSHGIGSGSISGTITNGTDYDMSYMAVWTVSYIMVFSEVKAGETIDIQQAVADGRCVYQDTVPYVDNLLHDMVGIYGYGRTRDYEQDDMAALFIGLGIAEEKKTQSSAAIIAGVVRDYDKVVTDRCSEISYGCFYSYAQPEGSDAAAQTNAGGN